ncbi:MAG: TOBE domain-containing protein, partial [Hyphomicrobiales bacterium]|nr:TOBE domain-containing protein [Hyphomicrobiales bacterium]
RLQRTLGVTTIYVTHDQTEAMTMGSKIVVMNDGQIQQTDTPHQLYHHPANTFVAQFVGTPPMNLLRCQLDIEQRQFVGDGVKVHCPEKALAALRNSVGDSGFLIGFRPEDIALQVDAPAHGFTGAVDVVEGLGHESLVNVSAGGNRFIARMAPSMADQMRPGDQLCFTAEPERLRFFAIDTGESIPVAWQETDEEGTGR